MWALIGPAEQTQIWFGQLSKIGSLQLGHIHVIAQQNLELSMRYNSEGMFGWKSKQDSSYPPERMIYQKCQEKVIPPNLPLQVIIITHGRISSTPSEVSLMGPQDGLSYLVAWNERFNPWFNPSNLILQYFAWDQIINWFKPPMKAKKVDGPKWS